MGVEIDEHNLKSIIVSYDYRSKQNLPVLTISLFLFLISFFLNLMSSLFSFDPFVILLCFLNVRL